MQKQPHVIHQYFDEIVKSIVKTIQIDSTRQPAVDGYPFGKGVADCLEHFLSLAKKYNTGYILIDDKYEVDIDL